jgi:hypothetical protein
MTIPLKVHPESTEPDAAEPAVACSSHPWVEWAAGAGAFALALAAMLSFMMNTIADRVDTLIEQQNTAALKLSDDLQYLAGLHLPADAPMPPGLFSDLVGFSRNTAIIMLEVHRLLALEFISTLSMEGEQPGEQSLRNLRQNLKPKDGAKTTFDHVGVDPRTTSQTIVEAGNYQIELYQSLRDFSQERCTSYKDVGGAISTYLFPLLYALLGAGLCDLRCRLTRARPPVSPGSARYTAAIIAGSVIGIFTSLVPTSLSLPPLLVAFLLGYSVETFTTRLDALIDKLRGPTAKLNSFNITVQANRPQIFFRPGGKNRS